MSKRELAARALGRPLLGQVRTQSGALRILAYHRIVAGPWEAFPFDEDLISATPQAFEQQMRWAKQNFDVLSFRDLESANREGRSWPKRALIVTFDDGYRDNYLSAFPILRELGVPGTIFLATGYIGQSRLFWWDTIAYCFKHAPQTVVTLPQISGEPLPLETPGQRRDLIQGVLSWVKQVPEAARTEFVDSLPDLLGVKIPADAANGMHLTWDEVQTMSRNGIEFGSHTVTHPILRQVDAEQLRFEVAESKAEIERQLGQSVHAFAYPAGTRSRRDEAAREMVKSCGYSFAVAYDQAVEADPDPYTLPRIHVDRDQSLDLFRANLRFPGVMLRS